MQSIINSKIKIVFLLAALTAANSSFKMLQANPLPGEGKSQLADLKLTAQQAVLPDETKANMAITDLRAAGPWGMIALESVHENALRAAYSHPEQKQTADWKRLANAFEKVGSQRDNWASRLYWFTNLDVAKREAKKQNKPILSLRLLGNLDEELSCANSRFFRTALYPNARIKQFLGEHYILHWQSVRPVPKVTIDFGDGRKIQTTITGNSIHYVLDAEGRVLDALPGLYGPGAFFKWLERLQNVNAQSINIEGAPRETFLRNFHQQRIAQIGRDWQSDMRKIPGMILLGDIRPKAPNFAESARMPDTFRQSANVQQTANAQQSPALGNQSTPAPTARQAGAVPMAKRMGEIGTLNAVTIPIPRDRAALARKADDDLWEKIAFVHIADAKLDNKSLEVLRTKTSRAQNVAATFEKSVAEDSVRNEYSRHATIHSWLAQNPNANLEQLNARVYSELFLTPDSDPWLGLLPADAYTGIQNDGVSK